MIAAWNIRPITVKKYRAIQTRFKYYYNSKRIRYDDCIKKIMEEFFIAHEGTVIRILNTELPDEVETADDDK